MIVITTEKVLALIIKENLKQRPANSNDVAGEIPAIFNGQPVLAYATALEAVEAVIEYDKKNEHVALVGDPLCETANQAAALLSEHNKLRTIEKLDELMKEKNDKEFTISAPHFKPTIIPSRQRKPWSKRYKGGRHQ